MSVNTETQSVQGNTTVTVHSGTKGKSSVYPAGCYRGVGLYSNICTTERTVPAQTGVNNASWG